MREGLRYMYVRFHILARRCVTRRLRTVCDLATRMSHDAPRASPLLSSLHSLNRCGIHRLLYTRKVNKTQFHFHPCSILSSSAVGLLYAFFGNVSSKKTRPANFLANDGSHLHGAFNGHILGESPPRKA